MHIHHNECTQGLALQLAQFPPHLVDHLFAYSRMVSKQLWLGSVKSYDACQLQFVGVQAQLVIHLSVWCVYAEGYRWEHQLCTLVETEK